MALSTEKKIWLVIIGFAGFFAYMIWNIFSPASFPMSFVRGEAREPEPGLVIGPYPTRDEVMLLKKSGVAVLVNLMDGANPVERKLIDDERKLAEAEGLEFRNYPMDFKRLGSDENRLSMGGALEYVLGEGRGRRVYVHCYLGRHRTGLFEKAFREARPGISASPPRSS